MYSDNYADRWFKFSLEIIQIKLYQRKHADTFTGGSQCVYCGFVTVIKQFNWGREGYVVISREWGGPSSKSALQARLLSPNAPEHRSCIAFKRI